MEARNRCPEATEGDHPRHQGEITAHYYSPSVICQTTKPLMNSLSSGAIVLPIYCIG